MSKKQSPKTHKAEADAIVRNVKRQTRRKFNSEEKILLENYYLPSELESRIGEFINHYNTRRYHESLNNLTPEDVWLGRGETILQQRRNIKAKTMNLRKKLYWQQKAA